MTRVLFLIPNLSHGGAEKVLVNLVNNMDKTKYKITVQTLFDCGVNKKYLNDNINYKYWKKKQFRGNSKLMLLFSPNSLFRKIIKNDRYEIIVSYLEGPTARIVSGCIDNDVRKVAWIHSLIHSQKEASSSFRYYNEANDCYSSFDRLICVSREVKNSVKKHLDLEFGMPIDVLYNTNDIQHIIDKSNEKIDENLFKEDVINIISVGKISKVKGYDRLARVHKELLEDGIKNKVFILGVGEDREEIEKYLSSNNLQDSFIFLGYDENPYKYVAKADLYVCSSLSEGLSTSVTESLIVGTPVVSTLCSGMKELLGDNSEYGIITKNDEESLYEGIKKILTTEGLLGIYKAKAKQRGKFFSIKNTVEAVENMLDSL